MSSYMYAVRHEPHGMFRTSDACVANLRERALAQHPLQPGTSYSRRRFLRYHGAQDNGLLRVSRSLSGGLSYAIGPRFCEMHGILRFLGPETLVFAHIGSEAYYNRRRWTGRSVRLVRRHARSRCHSHKHGQSRTWAEIPGRCTASDSRLESSHCLITSHLQPLRSRTPE